MNGDGQLDYAEFTKYLSAHGGADGESEPEDQLVSTNTATYSNRTQVHVRPHFPAYIKLLKCAVINFMLKSCIKYCICISRKVWA